MAESCKAIFENEMLLEYILDLVIYQEENKRCTKNVKVCRQVNKSWFEAVNKLVAQRGEPFLRLQFCCPTRYYPLFPLRTFREGYTSVFKGMKYVTPFHLSVQFNRDNSREQLIDFLHFLQLCGSGIVNLSVHFTRDETYLQEDDPLVRLELRQKLSLPVLQQVSLIFPIGNGVDAEIERGITYYELFTVPTIAAIFSGCKRLISLTLSCTSSPFPEDFKYLSLPSTITKVEINQDLCLDHVETLANNKDLKLTHLVLAGPPRSEDGGNLVERILETFSHTLESIQILDGGMDNTTCIQLPVMKSLQSFYFHARKGQLVASSPLEHQLPVLKKVELRSATADVVRNWTTHARFESVEELTAQFFREYDHRTVLTLELAQCLSQAFPNVTKLFVSTYIGRDSGSAFQNLLKSLTQLQILIVEITARCNSEQFHFLKSVFLAGAVQGGEGVDRVPEAAFSVDTMELRELTIKFRGCAGATTSLHESVFERVLLKMPMLQKLVCGSFVKVSPEMVELWRERGREFQSILTPTFEHQSCRCMSRRGWPSFQI